MYGNQILEKQIDKIMVRTPDHSISICSSDKVECKDWLREKIVTLYYDLKESALEDCSKSFVLPIRYELVVTYECDDDVEFTEKILDPIVNRLSNQRKLDHDEVKKRIRLSVVRNSN